MKSRYLSRVAACAVITSFQSASAFAQAEAEQALPPATPPAVSAETAETIVITGSYIRGTPEDAALPVDVFSSEDLTTAGVNSPLEFIKQLPSVGAVLGDSNQFATGAQGYQGSGSINLRGLGPTRTLVLLNGKRTIQSPGDGFTDTNLIPLFAIDRVEILKDGAAATYGSDAIAGVANFVTRQNFDGLELQADYNFIDGSDDNYQVSALFGKDFGTANLMVGFGWQHRSELPTTARDFSDQPYTVNPSGYSALSTPGTYGVTYFGGIDPGTGTPILNTEVVSEPGCNELGGLQTGAVCRFSYVPFDNIIEDEDRYQLFAQFNADLSDRLTFNVEGLYSATDQTNNNYSPAFPPTQGPQGSGFLGAFSVSPNNPFVPGFLDAVGLPQSGGANGPVAAVTALYWRPLGFLGNPNEPDRGAGQGFAKNDAMRFSGGFEYQLTDDIIVDLDATYWRIDRDFASPGIVGSRLQNALNGLGGPNCDPATGTPGEGGCQWFNPFVTAGPQNPALGLDNPFYIPGAENDPDLLRYIQIPVGTNQREEQFVIDFVTSGETGIELPGGQVAFAVGAQYRKNDYRSRPLADVSNLNINPCYVEGDTSCVGTGTEGVGPFIFLGGTRPVQLDQDVYAFFGEVNVPLFDTLELTGALRYEDYGNPVGSTFNPKGSFRFEPLDWLVLRGSIGTTFRGPLASNVAPVGVTSLAGLTATGGDYKSVDIFGNPALDPETALTYNVGVVVDTSGFTASVDYWTYDFQDQITNTPGDAIATSVIDPSIPVTDGGTGFVNCAAPLADLITFDGDACVQGVSRGVNIARVRTEYVNGPDVNVSGLDFALNYDYDAGFGTISAGGNASWTLEYKVDDFILNGVTLTEGYDAVGFGNYFRDPNTLPEWRANGYLNFATDALNLRYTVTFIDSVTDERPEVTDFGKESGTFVQHDFFATYNFEVASSELQLQAGVKNIFDEDPGEALLPVSYNPFIGNGLGRNYQVGLRARF
ncbi:TonB-dependent receptor domain-containing protein [Pacificimonas flava]|uniref:TonB-dependent receptor n=1 Tax=Pacificimonas flava TaxID=1234595 RepID=M2T921_9SPHN|nr:TonB-dependent receptor [Pacificimonas flava]EMD83019.1 TonB-dependent receptor [Pacificimonas flava]MBB5280177.1 outer membrane receptor protein involved in Fe transport [Pacificimonas flava]